MFEEQREGREGRGGAVVDVIWAVVDVYGRSRRSFVRPRGLVRGRDDRGHTRRGGSHTGSPLPAVTGAGPSNLTCSYVTSGYVSSLRTHCTQNRLALAGIGWHWLALAGTGWHWLTLELDPLI